MPKDVKQEKFINAESYLWYERVSATEVSFNEYRDFLVEELKRENELIKRPDYKKAPYFIINTTGRFGRPMGPSHDNKRTIEKEVFEFTPWTCGSLLFGYVSVETCSEIPLSDITWAKAVSISGAAVDGQYSKLDDNGERVEKNFSDDLAGGVLNIANGDLGYHIDNYNTNDSYIWVHKFLPFPLTWVHDWFLSDSDRASDHSTSIYLNDGGASENLGLFSLVRRGVKQIIVVDAEHDPESTFQAAKFVKNSLKEYGLTFTLTQPDGGINVYDAEPDEAVIEGKITGLVDEKGKVADINLIYIKLAVQAKHGESNGHGVAYPYTVKHFMEKNKAFPHNTTTDVSYDKAQFKAYRDLGCTLGKYVGWKGGELVKKEPQKDGCSK